jgi:hypothetical protein
MAKVLDKNASTVLVKMSLSEYKKLVDTNILTEDNYEFEFEKPVKASELLKMF